MTPSFSITSLTFCPAAPVSRADNDENMIAFPAFTLSLPDSHNSRLITRYFHLKMTIRVSILITISKCLQKSWVKPGVFNSANHQRCNFRVYKFLTMCGAIPPIYQLDFPEKRKNMSGSPS